MISIIQTSHRIDLDYDNLRLRLHDLLYSLCFQALSCDPHQAVIWAKFSSLLF